MRRLLKALNKICNSQLTLFSLKSPLESRRLKRNKRICRICRRRWTWAPCISSSPPKKKKKKSTKQVFVCLERLSQKTWEGKQTNLSEKSSVKLDDVGAVAAPHDHVEIHQQLLLLALVYRRPDPLYTHTHTSIKHDRQQSLIHIAAYYNLIDFISHR